jgi:hypothetical protein
VSSCYSGKIKFLGDEIKVLYWLQVLEEQDLSNSPSPMLVNDEKEEED